MVHWKAFFTKLFKNPETSDPRSPTWSNLESDQKIFLELKMFIAIKQHKISNVILGSSRRSQTKYSSHNCTASNSRETWFLLPFHILTETETRWIWMLMSKCNRGKRMLIQISQALTSTATTTNHQIKLSMKWIRSSHLAKGEMLH